MKYNASVVLGFDNLSGSHKQRKVTSAQVVKTIFNITSNRPSQPYAHPDDRTSLNNDMTASVQTIYNFVLKKRQYSLYHKFNLFHKTSWNAFFMNIDKNVILKRAMFNLLYFMHYVLALTFYLCNYIIIIVIIIIDHYYYYYYY